MSPELKAFFIFMQAWVDGGFQPNQYGIDKGFSLCNALRRWNMFEHTDSKVRYELSSILGERYPFSVDRQEFISEFMSGTMYQNQKRLDFIKEHSK